MLAHRRLGEHPDDCRPSNGNKPHLETAGTVNNGVNTAIINTDMACNSEIKSYSVCIERFGY